MVRMRIYFSPNKGARHYHVLQIIRAQICTHRAFKLICYKSKYRAAVQLKSVRRVFVNLEKQFGLYVYLET
jgi:hypothetical protein